MYVFTFQQLADALASADDPEDFGHSPIDLECDPDDSWLAKVRYFFGEARDTTFAELCNRGLRIDPVAETVTVLHADAMTNAFRLCNEIGAEYDATLDEVPTNWWETLGLGGDDDVDYNDGYLTANFNLIDLLLPEDYQARPAECLIDDSLYNLPADVLEAKLAESRAQWRIDNPERAALEDERARVHELVKAQLGSHGLCRSTETYQLYYTNPDNSCTVYNAEPPARGPWVFKAEGRDNLIVKEG